MNITLKTLRNMVLLLMMSDVVFSFVQLSNNIVEAHQSIQFRMVSVVIIRTVVNLCITAIAVTELNKEIHQGDVTKGGS